MRRFEFPLDRLLNVKKQLERVAELEQLRARDEADRARAALTGLRDQLARASERFAAAVGVALTAQQWATATDLTARLGVSIRAAEETVEAADRNLAAAARKRTQLATEVEALTAMRDQRWEEWKQEAKKADQDRIDELGLIRWRAARDDAAARGAP